ncbi:hypothetical protein QYF61_000397, partial [Mycteria americana]
MQQTQVAVKEILIKNTEKKNLHSRDGHTLEEIAHSDLRISIFGNTYNSYNFKAFTDAISAVASREQPLVAWPAAPGTALHSKPLVHTKPKSRGTRSRRKGRRAAVPGESSTEQQHTLHTNRHLQSGSPCLTDEQAEGLQASEEGQRQGGSSGERMGEKMKRPGFPHPLQVLEGCYKVSPEPSLLQAEQPQVSQPVFIREVLQPSDHLRGPPLDSLQQVHVLLILGDPELNAVLQVRSHKSGVEGENHLPRPAGDASFDAAQDTVGFLGFRSTLPGYVELLITQCHQVLLLRAALNPFSAQPVSVLGIAPTHAQHLALGLVELHEVCTGPPLKPVKVPLDSIPSLQRVDRTTQLDVVGKIPEGALNPTAHVADKDDFIPWYSTKQIPEEAKVCSPEGQGSELAVCPPRCPKDLKFHYFMVTAAKAVLELHIPHQPLLVGENKVQHSTSHRWLHLCHLEKEVIINAFQEPPRLLTESEQHPSSTGKERGKEVSTMLGSNSRGGGQRSMTALAPGEGEQKPSTSVGPRERGAGILHELSYHQQNRREQTPHTTQAGVSPDEGKRTDVSKILSRVNPGEKECLGPLPEAGGGLTSGRCALIKVPSWQVKKLQDEMSILDSISENEQENNRLFAETMEREEAKSHVVWKKGVSSGGLSPWLGGGGGECMRTRGTPGESPSLSCSAPSLSTSSTMVGEDA